MKRIRVILYITITGIISILVVMLVCDFIVGHNSKGRLYTKVSCTPQTEVGLLLGTTPQTRIGRNPNQFFKYRIDATAALYKAGKIKRILISGDENSLDGVNEVKCMRDSLIMKGIPKNIMILDGKGFRTLDAVVRATEVYGTHSYVVISQKFHNERAIFLAEHLGLDVHGIIGFNAQDATTNMAFMTYLREYFARVKVFVDIIFHKEPETFEK